MKRASGGITAYRKHTSLLIQQDIDGTHDFGRLPVLRAYDLAREITLAVYQVGFRNHDGPVTCFDFLRGVAIRGKGYVMFLKKLLVGGGIFVFADTENDA